MPDQSTSLYKKTSVQPSGGASSALFVLKTGDTMTGPLLNSYTSTASTPSIQQTGTWFTGGSSTTTKPHLLIEPSGTTSTGWSTSGTGLGVNSLSSFTGNLFDFQKNGTTKLFLTNGGLLSFGVTGTTGLQSSAANAIIYEGSNTGITSGNGDLMLSACQGYGIGFQASTSGATSLVGRFSNSGDFRINTGGVNPLTAIGTNNSGAVTNILRNGANSGTTSTIVALSFQTDTNTERGRIEADRAGSLFLYATSTKILSLSTTSIGVTDAINFSFGTTTGTKLGLTTSDKIGFWSATPIVQPTTAVAASVFVAGAGTAVDDASTFDGYTLKQVVKALRNTGLLA